MSGGCSPLLFILTKLKIKTMLDRDKIKLAVIHGLSAVGKMVNYTDKDMTIKHLKRILEDIHNESRTEANTKRKIHSEPCK